MKGKQDSLTKTAIEKMKLSYGKAICDSVNRDITSEEDRDAAVHAM